PSASVRVLTRPQPGLTVFTDASSQTGRAVVVWQDKGEWQSVSAQDTAQSGHVNIVTDSMFVFKLLASMATPGWAGTDIACMLESHLQDRGSTVSILHVKSHTNVPGYYQRGNAVADQAATRVYTLQDARALHDHFHIGARGLAKSCNI
ncbi:POL1 protein, partial [Amazona guildingii]|nr:POL1 protein [Amazona guildingii]